MSYCRRASRAARPVSLNMSSFESGCHPCVGVAHPPASGSMEMSIRVVAIIPQIILAHLRLTSCVLFVNQSIGLMLRWEYIPKTW